MKEIIICDECQEEKPDTVQYALKNICQDCMSAVNWREMIVGNEEHIQSLTEALQTNKTEKRKEWMDLKGTMEAEIEVFIEKLGYKDYQEWRDAERA